MVPLRGTIFAYAAPDGNELRLPVSDPQPFGLIRTISRPILMVQTEDAMQIRNSGKGQLTELGRGAEAEDDVVLTREGKPVLTPMPDQPVVPRDRRRIRGNAEALQMGWMIYPRPPADIRGEVDQICTFDNDTRSARPIKTCVVGSVWYVAVQVSMKPGATMPDDYQVDDLGRFVFAATIQTRRDRDGWAYRAVEEEAGPTTSQAPRSLIEMLSPTTQGWANAWRGRCLANAARRARRLADGDIIELAAPLELQDMRVRARLRR